MEVFIYPGDRCLAILCIPVRYLLYALYRWQTVLAYLILCVAVVYSVVFYITVGGGCREQSKIWFATCQEAAFLKKTLIQASGRYCFSIVMSLNRLNTMLHAYRIARLCGSCCWSNVLAESQID
jgi:hypothetical protein